MITYSDGLSDAKILCHDALEVMRVVYAGDAEKLKSAIDGIQQCCALIEDKIVQTNQEHLVVREHPVTDIHAAIAAARKAVAEVEKIKREYADERFNAWTERPQEGHYTPIYAAPQAPPAAVPAEVQRNAARYLFLRRCNPRALREFMEYRAGPNRDEAIDRAMLAAAKEMG